MNALYHPHIVFNNKHPVFSPVELFGNSLSGRVVLFTAGATHGLAHPSCAKPLKHDITTADAVFRL